MPELWFRYGSSEVVLDIRAENILKHARVVQEPIRDDALNSRFDALELMVEGSGSVGSAIDIVVLDGSRMIIDLASRLIAYLEGRGKSIDNVYATTKCRVAGREARPFKGIERASKRSILISRVLLDPLFKYRCSATALLRFEQNIMRDAYSVFTSIDGNPSGYSTIRDMIDGYVQGTDYISLEVIYGEQGLIDLLVCDTVRSYHEVSSRLDALVYATDVCRSIIASTGYSSKLSDAITALWNCSAILKKDGIIVVLAECTDGFGAKALQMLVEGRLVYSTNPLDKYGYGYIDGLEYIHILKAMGERGYDIGLLTMLPEFYVKALGFKPFRRIRDALAYILGKMGQRHKVMLASDALIMRMKALEQ
ncbi:MAG: hypothetical protein ACK4FV_00435 [Candidatus Nitrosocaldus sp.]